MRRGLIAAGAIVGCAFAAISGASATSPRVAGLPIGPGGVSSANVHGLLNVPTGTGVGGAFLGHYYFQTTSSLASFVGGGPVDVGGGLVVFDVTNPEQPVPTGYLPLPHWENEDVSISAKRNLLLISTDRHRSNPEDSTSAVIPGHLQVIDISVPQAPVLKSVTLYPASLGTNQRTGAPLGGPGHTATFVANDQYAYVSGSRDRSMWVVDLRDPAAPKVLGPVRSPAGDDLGVWTPGIVHDAYVDQYANVWATGSGGTAMYAPITDPMHPKLLAATSHQDDARLNQYIHHNAVRLDKQTVLVTEESYDAGDCGSADGSGKQDGSLQAWHIDLAHKRLVPVSTWDAPHNASNTGTLAQVAGACSSHWFTINSHKVVADAWYSAGLRFLDASDPKHLRPIGYYAGDSTVASQAVFVPGRPDLVYVADYTRGLDVVKLDNAGVGAKTVKAPAASSKSRSLLRPDQDFGWMCAHSLFASSV